MSERPPHFPDPHADPIVLLEAALAEKDENIASLYAEAKAWEKQAEAALMRIREVETELDSLTVKAKRWREQANYRPYNDGVCGHPQ